MSNADKEGVILHLFGWDKKFAPQFISFVQDHFPEQQHRFLVYGDVKADELPVGDSVTHYKSLLGNIIPFSAQLRNARKIILHGLFSSHLYYVLSLHAWLLKRCYWVIWGGDLYIHTKKKSDWRFKKDEFFRRFVISRIGNLVTYIQGDVDLARRWYGAKGHYHECLAYPSNISQFSPLPDDPHDGLHILLGNSADRSNNHADILQALKPLNDLPIKVFAPLSYGDQAYAQEVTREGRQCLGDKFLALRDFMPYEAYLRLLSGIDIAIFNHRRQQGMGNIITLLGMGKTVYIRSDISSWQALTGMGVTLGDTLQMNFRKLPEGVIANNQRIVLERFSEKVLAQQLQKIFSN